MNPFNRIVQISAVNGSDQFDELVNPQCHIPSDSTAIHHITNKMVKTASSFRTIFPRFRAFVKKCAKRNTRIVLVAHNAIGFDKNILEKECLRCGVKLPSHWCFYDTLLTYRREFADLPSKKLGDIYQTRFGEPITNAHDALADTLALQRLFRHDIQHLFQPSETVAAWSTSYTPSASPVLALRGIGEYTKRAVVKLLGISDPTVGDMRTYFAGHSMQDTELALRIKLRVTREEFLFSLLCEMTLHAEPSKLFAEFPFVISSFPGIPEDSVQKLIGIGLRSPEQVKRHYLFVLKESATDWDQFLDFMQCKPMQVVLMWRSI